MKQHIAMRSIKLAEYLLQAKATVREAAKMFGYSKSTVHKDITERLKNINLQLYEEVKTVLDFNLSVRHIRGGTATKAKYQNKL